MTWRNCDCPHFNYDEEPPDNNNAAAHAFNHRVNHRFTYRAERAVERHARHLRQTWGMPDPRSQEEQVREVRDAVENGCDHGYWRFVLKTRRHPGHCKLCKYVGHRFIFQCLFCPLTSCYACHTDAPPEYRRDLQEDEEETAAVGPA